MDERIELILNYFTSPPPDPSPVLTALQRRQRWQLTSDILNEGAPVRPMLAGQVVEDRGDRRITLDVFPPDGAGPHPTVYFIHGGAWIAGSPGTHRKLCLRFAEAGFLVLSVDYALAPEHPYPAGLDDCVVAADWIAAHAADYGGDPARLAIAGDSAGANLAAAVLDRLFTRDGRTPFQSATLFYGVYNFPALLALPEGTCYVTGKLFARQVSDYVGEGWTTDLLQQPGLSPLFSAHLGAFPPTQLIAGRFDPLLEQSREFAAALRRSAVRVDLREYEEMPHAFLQIEQLPACREAQAEIWRFLGQHLKSGGRTRSRT